MTKDREEMIKVICEAGSCHNNNIEYAKELIDLAIENKCWAIKFQLGKLSPPNITLPNEWWPELVDYATNREDNKEVIEIFASVFDDDAVNTLIEHNSKYMKISYSESCKNWWIVSTNIIPTAIVSCPLDRIKTYADEDIKLFCIPEYPVVYKINFDGLFPPFDGFSDHTLGYTQTANAITWDAKYIEKHITLDHDDISCPDNAFALKPKELKNMMKYIKGHDEYRV
ncbi:hypothetical protein LCGC14_2017450 [marine sediment metagenome]|uniref:PseI/NeuA/B-like domain-containing protein n=1 Tax=marine sediment metagenome TaxID=412755 RepID=A0A0F9HVM4_9ZZZZ